MTQNVSAQNVRSKFAEVLNTAVYGSTNVVITRFNKPQAVIISYKEYERLMNPKSRFSPAEWEKGFEVLDRVRTKNKKIPIRKIEAGVKQAIKAVRTKKGV